MARPPTILVKRHTLVVRITHWLNVLSLWLLLMSGLQIFNAHPNLYWGQDSSFQHPWLSLRAAPSPAGLRGLTVVGGQPFDTTGILGASRDNGQIVGRGFPHQVTLPGQRNLAVGRRWHFFFAWVFAINGLIYLATNLINGHLRRDLAPARDQLTPRAIWHDIVEHAQLKFPKGDEARRYNVLQKFTYLTVIFILLPLVALTGMTMSPGLDATFPILPAVFGGRQSARSIHFICANLIVLFVLVHVALVLLSGFWNNIRSMITGRYAIETGSPKP
jgi:thiosulfate reductase cytochrome b subunit